MSVDLSERQGGLPVQEGEGVGPRLEVVPLVDLGVERLPEGLDEPARQLEGVPQPRESVQADLGFAEPGDDLKVLRLRGERISRELDDLVPVGDLQLAHPVPLRDVVVGTARLADLVVQAQVLQVLPRRPVFRDRCERARSKSRSGASDDI